MQKEWAADVKQRPVLYYLINSIASFFEAFRATSGGGILGFGEPELSLFEVRSGSSRRKSIFLATYEARR
jgi:hypothetical protein